MRVFLFGSQTYSAAVIDALRSIGVVQLLGICGRKAQPPTLKERVARVLQSEKIHTALCSAPASPDQLGLRFFDCGDMAAARGFLEQALPDLILCCGFPKLIPGDVLATATHAINLHPGLLPERPGGTPVRWAVRLGDPEYGVTAHHITRQFDAGDIVLRQVLPLPPDATAGEAEAALVPHTATMAARVVRAALGRRDAAHSAECWRPHAVAPWQAAVCRLDYSRRTRHRAVVPRHASQERRSREVRRANHSSLGR
jgi:methionyl-tRNA formyltransferase